MRIIIRCISISAICLLINACGPSASKTPGSASRVQVEEWFKGCEGIEESKAPKSLPIPLVEFGGLPASFNRTKWWTGSRGQYRVARFPENSKPEDDCEGLVVIGVPGPAPVIGDAPTVLEPGLPGELDESKRTWLLVEVPGLKRSLRYHFGALAFGDMPSSWKTEPFTITTPDGKTGSYQAIVESENEAVAEKMFSKLRIQ
jgi:hypothetical protein